MKKLLPIFLILSVLAIVYGAKMYQYQDNPALNSEIENIYLEMQRGIRVKVGSFTCPAGTGNYSVTGVGFKPRCVEFRIAKSEDTVSRVGIGWTDYNGNQRAISWVSIDTTQFTRLSVICSIFIIDTSGNAFVVGDYVSMDTDGFTINFTSADSTFTIQWKAVR